MAKKNQENLPINKDQHSVEGLADKENRKDESTSFDHDKSVNGDNQLLDGLPHLNKKIVLRMSFAILLLLMMVGGGFWLMNNWQKITLMFSSSVSSRSYSENQQRVINNFGLPQTFTIAKDNDQILENWKYIYLDEIFVFQDGDFVARQHFNFDVELENGIYLNLEPKDFYAATSLEQLNQLLGREPSFEAEIDQDVSEDIQLFVSYDDLLNATLWEDKVIGLQTVALKSAPDTEISTAPSTGANDVDRPGKIYVANSSDTANSFSYYLDDPVFRLIKQRPLHLEGEYPSYGYCYSLDQGASFETEPQNPAACADEESMVWVINLYPPDVYDNFDEIEMMGMEELTRNNEFVYVITHTNGDLPADLPNWPTVLTDVKDDFSVPAAKEYISL